jgi:hypothetical protein
MTRRISASARDAAVLRGPSISRHTCYSHKCEPAITLYFLQQLASCLKPENMFKGERQ